MRLRSGLDTDLGLLDISWRGCSRDANERTREDPRHGHHSSLGPSALTLDICAEVDISMEYTPLYTPGVSRTQVSVALPGVILMLKVVTGVA